MEKSLGNFFSPLFNNIFFFNLLPCKRTLQRSDDSGILQLCRYLVEIQKKKQLRLYLKCIKRQNLFVWTMTQGVQIKEWSSQQCLLYSVACWTSVPELPSPPGEQRGCEQGDHRDTGCDLSFNGEPAQMVQAELLFCISEASRGRYFEEYLPGDCVICLFFM